MKRSNGKRILAVLLSAVLMGNCMAISGNAKQAGGRENRLANVAENAVALRDEKIPGNGTISGNSTVSGGELVPGNGTISGNNAAYNNGTVSGNDAAYNNDTVSGNNAAYNNDTVSGNNAAYNSDTVSGNDATYNNDTVSGNDIEESVAKEQTEVTTDEESAPAEEPEEESATIEERTTEEITEEEPASTEEEITEEEPASTEEERTEEASASTEETESVSEEITVAQEAENKEEAESNETENQSDAEKNNDQPTDEEGNVIPISDEVWIAGFEKESGALTYTGSKITQALRVYHEGTLLKEKTDYTLTYRNNVNAAVYNSLNAPSVTVTMKGQYSGSRTLYFTIAPRDIDEKKTQGYEQVVDYSKNLKLPAPTIYYGTKKLTANKDFTCDYSTLPENYTKGESYEEGIVYEYTVNGKGNFTGSFTMQLAVVRNKNLDLGDAVVTFDKTQYEYKGDPLTITDIGIHDVKIGKTNVEPEYYEYSVQAEDVGNGYVTIYSSEAGREKGYRGVKKTAFKVVGDRSIKAAEFGTGWQERITYSQKELAENGGICQGKEGVLFYRDGDGIVELVEGTDYTVKYSNHKKVGTATVVFTGMGRYTGTIQKTYKILPNTKLYVEWHDTHETGIPVTSYQKGGAVPQFDVLEVTGENSTGRENTEAAGENSRLLLSSKTDYTVKLRNNNKTGIMTCEITGKGNYKGYHSITEVKVLYGDLGQGTMSVQDRAYSSQKDAWKSTVSITDINGKKLTAGTDYDKNLTYYYEGMEDGLVPQPDTVVYVTASGKNNYESSTLTGSYRIYSMNISKLTVLIDEQEYTGKNIELSAEDIHVYASKKDAKNGNEITDTCYEIAGYSNNKKAGTAKVTLRGLGSYGGTKTYSFKIKKKKFVTNRVTGIRLDETSIKLGSGSSRQLTATVTPQDAWNKTVVWTTSDSKIATVSQDGIVTAVKPGTVTIRAVSQDTGEKASCRVKVAVIPVTSFSLNTEEIKQQEGTQYQLTAMEVQPQEATLSTIKWESTNPDVASVDDNGLVFLNKAGMAVIKAYVEETQILRKCLVFSKSSEENVPEGSLTPQMFRTSDADDDTAAFNAAIENLSGDCDTVYVPAGIYKIDAQTGIHLSSNMKFTMSPNAVLQAVDSSTSHYNVLYVRSVSNVTISGGQIIGERYSHKGSSGEYGMGIGVYDSSNILISGVKISDCWGDGIYLGSKHEGDSLAGCDQIMVRDCNLNNNRRNNLSIVCADNVTVDGCTFTNANGTAPEYGIDIEPNYANNPCEHITISNSAFSGNAQAAMGIITSADDIEIEGCTINGTFINYAGTNVTIADTAINGEMDARVGVTLSGSTTINDGSSEEDIVVASFYADRGSYTVGEYKLDASNPMSAGIVEDADSPSEKALQLKRLSGGTHEAGYYLDLKELTLDGAAVLEPGATYRFEYVMKGSGLWGIRTDQTGWYPCAPMADKYTTGYVTYQAKAKDSCRLLLYAVDQSKDMEWNLSSVKIYKER